MRFEAGKLYKATDFEISYGPLNHEELVGDNGCFDNRAHGMAADAVVAGYFSNLNRPKSATKKGYDIVRMGGGLWEVKTFGVNGADLQPSGAKGKGRTLLTEKEFYLKCFDLEGFIIVGTHKLKRKELLIRGILSKDLQKQSFFTGKGKMTYEKGKTFFGGVPIPVVS